MKKLFLFTALTMFSTLAYAMDYGVEVGFRQQSGSVGSGASSRSQTGYQGGVVANVPFEDKLGLRTGLFYVQRPLRSEADAGLGTANIMMTYFEVPVALSYRFEEYASVFGGVLLSTNLDSTISASGTFANNKVTEVKSPILPLTVGASFMFAPQMGATVFFESVGGDVAKGLSDYKAVGVNLLITFD